jgi:4-carboxymuconolactone decarboxylase
MAPNETAQRNHAELFPGHVSTLAHTDPELISWFDDFAFDEVLAHTSLETRTRLMVILAALIATQSLDEYRVITGAALTVGVIPVEIKEIVYQAVPYAGMGKVFPFLHATNDVLREHGVELPLPGQSTTTPDTRYGQGLAVQKRIVGDDTVEAMYAGATEDTAHIQRFLSANCFGDHYTRSGLDVPTRELLTFAMLAAMGGADPQVRGHVAGNLHVGNTRADLLAVITALLPFIGYPRTLNALAAVNDQAPAQS